MSIMGSMKSQEHSLILVDPNERHALKVGGSVLFFRRLSLGACAAIEGQQAKLLAGTDGQRPRPWLPPAALEAAICAQVLVGWQGVRDGDGREIPYSRDNAARLPAWVRGELVKMACQLIVNDGEEA